MDAVYAHGEATATQVLVQLPDPPMRGALRTLLRNARAIMPRRAGIHER